MPITKSFWLEVWTAVAMSGDVGDAAGDAVDDRDEVRDTDGEDTDTRGKRVLQFAISCAEIPPDINWQRIKDD